MGKLRVKELLKEKEITLSQLADRMCVHRANVQKLISDNSNPSLNSLNKIATALKCDVVDLFETSSKKHEVSGHIEVDNKIYKVKSLEDLKRIIGKIEQE